MIQSVHTRTLLTLAAATTMLLAGCHKKTSAAPPYTAPAIAAAAAPTATLTASPEAIDVGQSVTLTWRTSGASSVSIDGIGPVNLSGTQNVTPSNSTNFHLTATGDGGSSEANVRVTVRVPVAPTSGSSSNLGDTGSESAFHAAVKDVFFDYDSADLRPDAQSNASQAATYLNAHTGIKVLIGGYCDERGSAEYNLALGETRANAARTALVNAGVPASRVRVISYGKEKQFCTEQAESCYQQNRRAQFLMDK
ncbi:MAG: OmpA family protein [Janthinobacterium lividum]